MPGERIGAMNSSTLLLFNNRMRQCISDAPERRLHAVSDSRREFLRPLVHRLVGHADSLGGGGYRAAEEFDRLCLAHAPLNHSSWPCATIVQQACSAGAYSFSNLARMAKQGEDSESKKLRLARDALERKAYGKRLSQAFEAEKAFGVTIQQLADTLGISYQGIKKALNEGVMPGAKNNAMLAKLLRVNSDWLATGEGEVRPMVNPEVLATEQERQMMWLFRSLSPEKRDAVYVAVNDVARNGTVSAADPYAKAPKPGSSRARGVSRFNELDEAPSSSPASKRTAK